MAKLKPNEKRVQLSFQRSDDLGLYAFLEKRAYERRYDLPTFILLSLHEAFEGQIEPVKKIPDAPLFVPEKIGETVVHVPVSIDLNPPSEEQLSRDIYEHGGAAPKIVASTDDGYEATKAAIVQNNALFQKKGKMPKRGTIPLPDTIPAVPPALPE
ncbi:MAG: hypothetical protein ACYCOU_00180 [Sulfobacillus sp.]